jgi:hypothetical protein
MDAVPLGADLGRALESRPLEAGGAEKHPPPARCDAGGHGAIPRHLPRTVRRVRERPAADPSRSRAGRALSASPGRAALAVCAPKPAEPFFIYARKSRIRSFIGYWKWCAHSDYSPRLTLADLRQRERRMLRTLLGRFPAEASQSHQRLWGHSLPLLVADVRPLPDAEYFDPLSLRTLAAQLEQLLGLRLELGLGGGAVSVAHAVEYAHRAPMRQGRHAISLTAHWAPCYKGARWAP